MLGKQTTMGSFCCCLFLMSLILVPFVTSHSWIACTDYLEEDGAYWDADLCRSFPRHAGWFANRANEFGSDTGLDHRPQENSPCKTSRDDNGLFNNNADYIGAAYSDDHPMAVYYPGQRVVIAHPTKNHVADVDCTNKYIPDHGNYIFSGPRDSADGQDPAFSTFHQYKIADFGVSPFGYETPDSVTTTYPKPGYQNAPAFCENMDKALATAAFEVPPMDTGRYTFMWEWAFNNDNDLYTTCFEVDVVASRDERDAILLGRGQSTEDLGSETPIQPPTDGNSGGSSDTGSTDNSGSTSDSNNSTGSTGTSSNGDTGSDTGSDSGDATFDLNGLQCTCDCTCSGSESIQTSSPRRANHLYTYKGIQIP